MKESAWAFHGLSCVKLAQGEKEQAGDCILQGMAFKRKELSYLKEGFRILLLAEKYEELSRFYRKLDKEEQEAVYIMRRALNGMKSEDAVENILNLFVHTRTNRELVAQVRRQRYV